MEPLDTDWETRAIQLKKKKDKLEGALEVLFVIWIFIIFFGLIYGVLKLFNKENGDT
jgi:hypothetical protein